MWVPAGWAWSGPGRWVAAPELRAPVSMSLVTTLPGGTGAAAGSAPAVAAGGATSAIDAGSRGANRTICRHHAPGGSGCRLRRREVVGRDRWRREGIGRRALGRRHRRRRKRCRGRGGGGRRRRGGREGFRRRDRGRRRRGRRLRAGSRAGFTSRPEPVATEGTDPDGGDRQPADGRATDADQLGRVASGRDSHLS